MKIKETALLIFMILMFLGCSDNRNSTEIISPKSKEFRETDYNKVQGIVLKMVAVEASKASSNSKSDIYYVYSIDQPEPKIGVEKDSDSRFSDDDLITIWVNKKKPDISFIDRRGMVDQEMLYRYLTRADSSFYVLKRQVPFE